MQSLWIVKTFDVIVGRSHGVFVCFVFFVVNFFDFESFEEAFHRRVVVFVSLSFLSSYNHDIRRLTDYQPWGTSQRIATIAAET